MWRHLTMKALEMSEVSRAMNKGIVWRAAIHDLQDGIFK
jgi:hypothetical protein